MQNPDVGISSFRISGHFLIRESCHNSRTSADIAMKLGIVTKIDRSNKTRSKKFDDDFMSQNHDVIFLFQIYDQCGAVWKPDSERIFYKTYVFTNGNFLSHKNWK